LEAQAQRPLDGDASVIKVGVVEDLRDIIVNVGADADIVEYLLRQRNDGLGGTNPFMPSIVATW
jgi:hypothetical protein